MHRETQSDWTGIYLTFPSPHSSYAPRTNLSKGLPARKSVAEALRAWFSPKAREQSRAPSDNSSAGGIDRVFSGEQSNQQPRRLIKLAYRGRPSRAEFPLTKEFATHSNNSTVGLTGKAVLINSVQSHIEEGKPYYECDTSVQSELCLPIFSNKNETVGIIDLESFRENHFINERILKAATACISLSDILNSIASQLISSPYRGR